MSSTVLTETTPTTDYLSTLWLRVIDQSGLSDRMVFVLGNTSLVYIWFWPINFLLYLSYRYNFPGKSKFLIQPSLQPDHNLVWKNIKENLFSHVVVVPLLSYFLYDIFVYFGLQIRSPLPSLSIVLRDISIAIFFADMLGYWLHRILHHKAIYKYVHKKHHEYKVNVGIASIYAHPVEEFFTNIVAVFGNMIMGSHVLVLWLWLSIRLIEAIFAHSGYHFLPYWISCWFTGGDYHEYHHSHNVGNYGQFFTIWDWMMGTDVSYYKFLKSESNGYYHEKEINKTGAGGVKTNDNKKDQ
jgi:sterol desaturase/sphingolipid hydroxylase (fatty acid hydroxylase superfamily)